MRCTQMEVPVPLRFVVHGAVWAMKGHDLMLRRKTAFCQVTKEETLFTLVVLFRKLLADVEPQNFESKIPSQKL